MESYYLLKEHTKKIGSGFTPKGGNAVYVNDGVSFIRSQNVYNMMFSYKGLAHITSDIAKSLNNVEVEKDDILINITGDSVARCCLVPDDVLPARVNQHVSIIRTNPNEINPLYLMYYLNYSVMQKYLIMVATGKGASRKAITKGMLEKLLIPKNQIDAQNNIVEILSSYDEQIKLNNKRITLLEEIADLIYKEWFVNCRFPNYNYYNFKEDAPKNWKYKNKDKLLIPENWHFGKLKELCEFKRGHNITSNEMIEGDYDVISAGLGPSGKHNKYNVESPCLTISASGANAGFLSYHTENIWAADCSYYHNKDKIWFIYCSLKFIEKSINNLQIGSAQPHVYPKHINNLNIIIPEAKIIKKFNDNIEPLFNEINEIIKINKNLYMQKELLLPRLMSGKIKII